MDVASNDILDQQDNVVANRVYSKKEPEAPYVVRYHFLYGENAGYSGMARYYRTYLAQNRFYKKAAGETGFASRCEFFRSGHKKEDGRIYSDECGNRGVYL